MNPPRYDTQCCPGYNDKVESGGNLGKLWVIVSIARFTKSVDMSRLEGGLRGLYFILNSPLT